MIKQLIDLLDYSQIYFIEPPGTSSDAMAFALSHTQGLLTDGCRPLTENNIAFTACLTAGRENDFF